MARPRNTKITSTTSTKAMHSVACTSLDAVDDRLRAVVDRHDPDRARAVAPGCSGSRSLTDWATSTALEPACRKTATTTVAEGTSVPADPEAHVDPLVLDRIRRRWQRLCR